MHFRSFEDLNRIIISNLSKIPPQTDLIVGIPRSGLLAANILALHLNTSLTDLDGFVNGTILSAGTRMKEKLKPFDSYKHIVVLDDSISSGAAMEKSKEAIAKCQYDKNILYGAVFATPQSVDKVNFYMDVCPRPRMFEWNLMHHMDLINCCVDIDGVLCKDPTEEENDDGEKYLAFLANTPPLLKPTIPLGYLVTNRLEKYRSITEEWLQKNNIVYKKLIMSELKSKQERIKANRHAEFKAQIYVESGAMLFIESSEWQACKIANITNKPVYCTDIRKMISGTGNTRGNIITNMFRRKR